VSQFLCDTAMEDTVSHCMRVLPCGWFGVHLEAGHTSIEVERVLQLVSISYDL
jgi:hypothetical protein